MKLIFCIAAALSAFTAIPLFIIRGEKFGKRRAYLMIFCSALFFSSVFIGAEHFFSILESFWPSRLYAAEITSDTSSFIIPSIGTGEITLNVINRGALTWDSLAEREPVFLGWHLHNERGVMIRFDNTRAPFSLPIPPGESERVVVHVSPALEGIPAGRYLIEFDLVCENVTWFADRGSATCRIPMEVLP